MIITNDDELQEEFLTKLTDLYSRQYKDIHVSDLTLCLRQAAYKKLCPKRTTLEQLNFFVDGACRDMAIKEVYGNKGVKKLFMGIRMSTDVTASDGFPIEMKSTRASNGISDHYLTQLTIYMVLQDMREGHLIIQRIVPKQITVTEKQPPFEFKRIIIDEDEFQKIKYTTETNRDILKTALAEKNPLLCPVVHKKDSWVCKSCQWNSPAECPDKP